MLSTVDKACQVLSLFTEKRPEWGITEIAQALELSKSSVHGIVSTLCAHGILRRTPRGRYRLGWRILALNDVISKTSLLRQEARESMKYLARTYGETVHLATYEQGRIAYIEKEEGTHAVRVDITGAGRYLPAHCTALGKTLLAFQPWKEVKRYVATHGLPAYTSNTITSMETLEQELIRIRQKGYAIDNEEIIPELCCIAGPIRNEIGTVVAALSFSVPSYRFHKRKERYKEAILSACRKISWNLGYLEKPSRK